MAQGGLPEALRVALGEHHQVFDTGQVPAGPAEVALEMAQTFAFLRAAAEARRFVSYGAVAAASGLSWQQARRRMDPHLFALCHRATGRGWPLLSAIVVDQRSVVHGRMGGRPLIGFARAAERCGRIVGGDAAMFLAAEQIRVFDWAEKERGHVLHH